jgi:broad specificity phosphatase PhoE
MSDALCRNVGRIALMWRLLWSLSMAACVACVLLIAIPVARAAGQHTIVVTFIRHAQSSANVSGIIDTAVPGPDITDLGRQQAQDVANQLSVNRYDGIYASTMVRTQETAAPMSEALDEPVTVLPGLRELEAGANDGLSVTDAPVYRAPGVWLDGHRSERIPGSVTGDEFDARFDAAMQSIYDSGKTNVVAFSHGAAIYYWVQMNVKNPNREFKNDLSNTAHVVVTGSPTEGWTLANWDGATVGA